jgi:hypothetical protein
MADDPNNGAAANTDAETTQFKPDPKAKNGKAPPQTRAGVADAAADPDAPQPDTTGDVDHSHDETHLTDNTTINDPNQGVTEDDAEDIAEKNAYERAHPGSLGLITEPEHALPVLRAKVNELHSLMNNIGNVAEVPIHAIEALGADIGYLLRMFRHGGQNAGLPKPAPIMTQQPAPKA